MRALIAASLAAAMLTGAAAAQPVPAGILGAIAHFNLDRESGHRIRVPGPDAGPVSSFGHGFDGIFAHFNAGADGQDDVRGLGGATLMPGEPAFAREIFERIEAESAGSE